jgi:hypothetical protein
MADKETSQAPAPPPPPPPPEPPPPSLSDPLLIGHLEKGQRGSEERR